MSESILDTIKKLLGIEEDDENFDTDIIVLINSAFSELSELGFGPKEGYRISGKENLWSEVATDGTVLEMVKTCIFMKVKIIFDPPSNSFTLESMRKEIERYEWRINSKVESTI